MDSFHNTPDRPAYLVEISLRQSDGPKSDPLILALQELLARAVRDASQEPEPIEEGALAPPDDPDAVAKARKVEARLDHLIEQSSAANSQRQEELRALAQEELLRRQEEAARRIREAVARLLRNGVLALESQVTESAVVAE